MRVLPRVEVGEIREWLCPRGYNGEYHRFMVIEAEKSEWSDEISCKIRYSNGYIQDIWLVDLFKDPEDPDDNEYSVRIDEEGRE